LLIWLELTDDLKPDELVPGAYALRSTDFGARYMQEWYQLTERDKREEYLCSFVRMS
jgi:hypothetical protein